MRRRERVCSAFPAKVPEGYPWKGEAQGRLQYLTCATTHEFINRFRPWSAEPFATVELFK